MDIERELLRAPLSSLPLKGLVTVAADASLAEAIGALQAHHVGCVLVLDGEGRLLGLFTERDLLTKVAGRALDWEEERVSATMTREPQTLRPEDPIASALSLMHRGGFRHVPLTDAQGRAVGVASVKDIVDVIVELFPAAVLNLPPRPRRAPQSDHGDDDEE